MQPGGPVEQALIYLKENGLLDAAQVKSILIYFIDPSFVLHPYNALDNLKIFVCIFMI